MRRLRHLLHLIVGLLRELSDEAGYQRHLTAHGAVPSAGEWKRFSDEKMRAKYARPKCC